jgi:hypothetical protein
VFLLGFLVKTGARTWCFGGEFVVLCVVNVVVQQPVFGGLKDAPRISDLFFEGPRLGVRVLHTSVQEQMDSWRPSVTGEPAGLD